MSRTLTLASFVVPFVLVACGGSPVFSEERTQRSKELYGQQQEAGQDMNRTPSEIAARNHEDRVRPAKADEDEKEK